MYMMLIKHIVYVMLLMYITYFVHSFPVSRMTGDLRFLRTIRPCLRYAPRSQQLCRTYRIGPGCGRVETMLLKLAGIQNCVTALSAPHAVVAHCLPRQSQAATQQDYNPRDKLSLAGVSAEVP